jgi:hypothetical protein
LSLDKVLRRNNQDKPDFWTALGYDFIRFAAGLSLPPGAGPDQVNNLLARRSMKNWALAPISWDAQGRAAQDMFVLQPSSGSLVPVHLESLKARRSMRQARRERLLQQLHPERTPFESKEQKP